MCNSHSKIVGAWALAQREIIESAVNPSFGEPDKEAQRNMILQAQVMVSIAETHQKLYGKVRHILVSFEHFDSFLFPLNDKDMIVVGCLRPYTFEDIINASEKILTNHATK
jgi:hypothetical protein